MDTPRRLRRGGRRRRRVKNESVTVSRVDWRRRRRDESLTERADALYPTAAAKDLHKSRRAWSFLPRAFARFARASGRVEWDVIYDAARCGYGDWENAEKQEHLQSLRS